jgi:putative hemin transport protein
MSLDLVPPLSPADLRQARADNPKMRAYDLAAKLGVTEAALVAAQVDGAQVVRIDPTLDRLIPQVQTLGEVMALTRNRSVVHERHGVYQDWHPGPHAAMVLGAEIDLRMFPKHWVHGFVIRSGPRPSIQIFDAAGDGVHKIFLGQDSGSAALDRLVADLRLDDQGDSIMLAPRAAVEPAQSRPDRAGDLRRDWADLTDTHQFLRVVSRLKMNRLGAYRVVGQPWAEALAPQAVADIFYKTAQQDVPIMLFVGNQGCIQIHGGAIERVEPMGPWLNVLDPRFNLHLRMDHVAEVWLVAKPTRHGLAHSIEAFDADGALILQLFGKRDPDYARFDALLPDLPRAELQA